MVGTWRGKGRGDYPTIESFEYAHEVVFNHDGRPFLNYYSRSWIIDKDGEIIRPAGSETGFWRVKPNNVLEVLISHNTGITEGWVGQFDGPKIQLVLDQGYSAPSAKITALDLPSSLLSRAEDWISAPTTSIFWYMPVLINWSAIDRA